MCVCYALQYLSEISYFFRHAILPYRLRGTGSPPAPWPVGDVAKLIAKPPSLIGKSTINEPFFHSYVKLPEGIAKAR